MSGRPERAPLGLGGVLLTGAMLAAIAMLSLTLGLAILARDTGWDARFAYLGAAHAVLHGNSPYPDADKPLLDADKSYVYPPQVAIAFVSLAWMPVDVAAAVAALASIAAILGALALLGTVRDWRCYAAVLVWAPVWNAVDTANISAVLTLLVAVAWRFRTTLWPLASAVGVAVSLKLFLWPLLLWTSLVRGARATLLAVVLGGTLTVAAWAVIGFAGFTEYPTLLGKLSDVQAARSYSLVGISDSLGFGTGLGEAASLVVGGALLLACVRFGREADERRALTCALAAAIALTPILWQHYLVLLIVPVALARPRFSAVWLAPAALWAVQRTPDAEGYERFVPLLVAAVVVGAVLARPRLPELVAETA